MRKLNWILLLLITMISCNNESAYDYPLVLTGSVINITDSSATFTAKTTNPGKFAILESGFIWSLYPNNNNGIKVKNKEISDGVYELNTNEKLLPGRIYYVRAYIQTESSITYGREVTFKSLDKDVSLGRWSNIYHNVFTAYWADKWNRIDENFTINDSTFIVLNDGKLYCYSHIANTCEFVTLTSFRFPDLDFSIVYNENAYVFSKNAFYQFDRHALSFNKLSVLNDNKILRGASGCLIDDNIYVGSAQEKEFWKYNIPGDTWQQVSTFPGGFGYDSYSFYINNTIYFGITGKGEFWSYDPENNQWIQKVNSPFNQHVYIDYANTISKGYCFYNKYLYEYNPIFDIWERMACLVLSYGELRSASVFTIGHKIYVLNVYINYLNVWEYEK